MSTNKSTQNDLQTIPVKMDTRESSTNFPPWVPALWRVKEINKKRSQAILGVSVVQFRPLRGWRRDYVAEVTNCIWDYFGDVTTSLIGCYNVTREKGSKFPKRPHSTIRNNSNPVSHIISKWPIKVSVKRKLTVADAVIIVQRLVEQKGLGTARIFQVGCSDLQVTKSLVWHAQREKKKRIKHLFDWFVNLFA